MVAEALHDLPSVCFELSAGAAERPLPGGYRRREPENTALHAVVRENLETLLPTTPDGRVRLQLLRPWPNPAGRTEIVLDPQAFLRRMAALVPAPYQNLVRYHGVFANRSRFRPLLPKPPARIVVAPIAPIVVPSATDPASAGRESDRPARPHRMSWAALLKRVLDVDALACPGCGAAMVVLAFLTDPPVVRRILEHLDLPSVAPRLSPPHEYVDTADLWPGDDDGRPASSPTHRRCDPRRLPPRSPP